MLQFAFFRFKLLLALVYVASIAQAQGVSLSISAKDARFFSRDDGLMGAVIFGTDTGLEYMRCLAGQTYQRQVTEKAEQCQGNPQLLSFSNAQRLVNQVGSGWRLPTLPEMQKIMNSRTYVDSLFWTEPPYRGAFVYKEVMGGYWTSDINAKSPFANIAVGNGLPVSESLAVKEYEGFAYAVANGSLAQVRLVRKH